MPTVRKSQVNTVDDSGTMALGRVAYETLRDAIENGSLRPGDRVSVNALADMMNLSRTPVKEAITWLESDGLIAHEPSRGRVIAELDHQMINELSAIRLVLETTGVGLAARNASEAEIDVLRDMLVIEKSLLDDPLKRERHNRRFHEAIHRCAHNRYLISSLKALQTPMLLLGPATSSDPARLKDAYAEHIELVEAIAQHDSTKAQEIITRHLNSGQRARIKHILQKLDERR